MNTYYSLPLPCGFCKLQRAMSHAIHRAAVDGNIDERRKNRLAEHFDRVAMTSTFEYITLRITVDPAGFDLDALKEDLADAGVLEFIWDDVSPVATKGYIYLRVAINFMFDELVEQISWTDDIEILLNTAQTPLTA